MRVVSDLPRPVRTLEHVWIPLSDGSRLGARIWLPEDAEEHPVPAVVDYIPYRKGDGTAPRDASRFSYLAGHGYAGVRVDIRGSGESDGLLTDEYLPQEQEDGVEVLRWLGEQSWCTGACGMIGISWGGFSGLQVAALRPPELKAVITLCSTDDRYADDVHYRGGAVLALEMLSWGTSMLSFNAMAPDPAIYGDGWRDAWLERIDGVEPYVHTWMEHQRRDPYRCARTRPRSSAPCTRSVGGSTATPTPCCAWSSRCTHPATGCSDPGRTRSPTSPSRVRRSGSCRSACAGGTSG
jgi:putative CocE/NonD family hydrolase